MTTPRRKTLRTALAVGRLGLAVLALAAVLAGWSGVAIALLGVLALIIAADLFALPQSSAELPNLSVESAEALRVERDRDGEVPAVRTLRSQYPELSLVQAVQMVRSL